MGALPEYANLLIETPDYELCARLMIVTLGEETRSRLGWDEVLPSREIPLAQGYSVSMRDEFYGALVDPDGNELDMRCGRRDLNKLSLTFEYPLWGLVSSYADMWGRPYFVDMIGKYYLNREGRLLDLTTPRIVLPETFSNLEAEELFSAVERIARECGLSVEEDAHEGRWRFHREESDCGVFFRELCGVYTVGEYEPSPEVTSVPNRLVVTSQIVSGDVSVSMRALAYVVGSFIRGMKGLPSWGNPEVVKDGCVEVEINRGQPWDANWLGPCSAPMKLLKNTSGETFDVYMGKGFTAALKLAELPKVMSHLLDRDPREILDALLDPDSTWQGFTTQAQ